MGGWGEKKNSKKVYYGVMSGNHVIRIRYDGSLSGVDSWLIYIYIAKLEHTMYFQLEKKLNVYD